MDDAFGGERDDEYVTVRRRSVDEIRVLEVVLDRAAKRNALPSDSLAAAIAAIASTTPETADVVTIAGAGEHFCAGSDVAELEADLREGVDDPAEEIHDVVEAVRSCPLPVVASVAGNAFGAGFLICMAADMVVADTTAVFGLQEVRLGIPVAGYASTVLPRIVGEHRAREWLFTGRTVDAEEAEAAGFANRVVPPENRSRAVEDCVRQLGAGSPLAIRLLKERMASPTPTVGADAVRSAETAAIRTALEDGDVSERLRALLDS